MNQPVENPPARTVGGRDNDDRFAGYTPLQAGSADSILGPPIPAPQTNPAKTLPAHPTPEHPNIGILVTPPGSPDEFTTLMVETPSSNLTRCADHIQFLPRWTYHCVDSEHETSADGNSYGCRRVDNITDTALADYRRTYGNQVTKDHIFFYIYALLHSPDYRDEFAADLKKTLPRIPNVDTRATFDAFTEAGRELLDLHADYKHAEPWIGLEITGDTPEGDPWDWYRPTHIRYGDLGSVEDKTAIVYNSRITITGIPLQAQAYTLGAKSALDWIVECYQTKTDKTTGIVNDPNRSKSHDEPRRDLDLLTRIITVSTRSVEIVESLPRLRFTDAGALTEEA